MFEGKRLSPEQRDAVDKVVDRTCVCKRKGQILLGGTGCGKTLTSIVACNETVVKFGEKKVVLCIVPSMGETVFNQWRDELADQGCAERTLIYHGSRRLDELTEFRHRFDAATDVLAWYVITSIDTLHADVNNVLHKLYGGRGIAVKRDDDDDDGDGVYWAAALDGKRKAVGSSSNVLQKKAKISEFAFDQVVAARHKAVASFGKVHIMLVDEFQTFRNGSPPTDSARQIDHTKTFYVTLDTFHRMNKPTLTLGLTATPTQNTSGEAYSFLRFIDEGRFPKDSFVQATKDKAVTKTVCREFVVKLSTPDIPPTTYGTVKHGLSDEEVEIHAKIYAKLYTVTDMFLKAIKAWSEAKNCQALIAEKERCKMMMYMYLTRARRTAVHPALSSPPDRADPEVDPARNAAGEVRWSYDDEGNTVKLGRKLPVNTKRAKEQWPINKCSKMSAMIDRLAEITNERVVIQFTYSDPCDLFEMYFRDRFPGREVYVYHGGRSKRAAVMEAFKLGAADAVLIATRGSCEMAVNIECTTNGIEYCPVANATRPRRLAARQIFGDLPMSSAEQTQAEGRTKRPKAQGHPSDSDRVMHWYAETALSTEYHGNTIENFLQKAIEIKEARCGDFLRDDEDSDSVVDQASTKNDEIGNEGILRALLETLAPYANAIRKKTSGGKVPSGSRAPASTAAKGSL